MWDLAINISHWRLPVRKASLFATILFVASFLCALIVPTVALAADASWSGDNLSYDKKVFAKKEDIKSGDNRNPVVGTHVYEYLNNQTKTLEVLFIDKGIGDVKKATTAQYVIYKNFTPPDTFSEMSSPQSVTISATAAAAGSTSTCDSSIFEGLGWILCPLSNVLAKAVDSIYGIISNFLVVTTLTTDRDNAIFKIWQIIVSIANICFILAFLYIVYLHLVSVDVEKHQLFKKALPRMLIAAILVNVSYWICALAVDTSNLLGYSVERLFVGVRESVGLDVHIDWSAMTAFILSAGAVGAGGGIIAATGALATLETFAALGYLLIATLIPAILAAMVAFLILAARQALIVIFIIISPLAFVAWTLPNTEKYFKKWLNAFMTLLLMFPLFSVIFGGSLLAGAAIMNSANGSLIIALIGMAVQIAPLAITPMIIRFSTGVLGQIANITNNSKRGLADRTRNWATDNANYHKDRNNGKDARSWALGHRTGHAVKRRSVVKDRRRKGYQQMAENRALGHRSYTAADELAREAERDHKRLESDHTTHWNQRMKVNTGSLEREMAMRHAEQASSLSQAQIDVAFENARAGRSTYGLDQTIVNRLQNTSETAALTGMAKSMAEYRQRQNESDVLINEALSTGSITVDGKTIRDYAGGILDVDDEGANKALAYAVATRRSQFGKSVEEATQLQKHFNPSSEQLQDLVTGRANQVTSYDLNGKAFTFSRQNVFAMEAAIEKQIATGTVNMVDEIIERSGSDLAEYRTTISDALAKAGHGGRSIYEGGSLINEIAKGTIASRTDLTRYIQEQIAKGKVSPAKVAVLDSQAAARFLEAAMAANMIVDPALNAAYAAELDKLKQAADRALEDEQIKSSVANNTAPILDQIRNL